MMISDWTSCVSNNHCSLDMVAALESSEVRSTTCQAIKNAKMPLGELQSKFEGGSGKFSTVFNGRETEEDL